MNSKQEQIKFVFHQPEKSNVLKAIESGNSIIYSNENKELISFNISERHRNLLWKFDSEITIMDRLRDQEIILGNACG
jgi:hypothetical protein